jgi:hypothetical protein
MNMESKSEYYHRNIFTVNTVIKIFLVHMYEAMMNVCESVVNCIVLTSFVNTGVCKNLSILRNVL